MGLFSKKKKIVEEFVCSFCGKKHPKDNIGATWDGTNLTACKGCVPKMLVIRLMAEKPLAERWKLNRDDLVKYTTTWNAKGIEELDKINNLIKNSLENKNRLSENTAFLLSVELKQDGHVEICANCPNCREIHVFSLKEKYGYPDGKKPDEGLASLAVLQAYTDLTQKTETICINCNHRFNVMK